MNSIIAAIAVLLPSGMPDPLSAAKTIAEIVWTSASVRAQRMAEEAFTALSNYGINPSTVSAYTAMAFAARLELEKLCALGLLRRSKFVTRFGKQIKATAANRPDIISSEDARNFAFFLDVCCLIERHFSPSRTMLLEIFTKGELGDNPKEKYLVDAPLSEEAVQAIASLQEKNFTNLKVRPVVSEPVSIDDLLKECRLTEPEAARILRRAPKTLADQRRDGCIPESLYVQDAKDGTVYYLTQKLLTFATSAGGDKKHR
jgi:hypothetical protein